MEFLNFLSELPFGVKVSLSLISAPLASWLTWLKIKKGSFSLSQARTKRLYELMLLKDARAMPSGALTMAVKEALNVELDGDKIRFALQHDNPLFVLRAFKFTLGTVRMSTDGTKCEDAKSRTKKALQRKKTYYIYTLFVFYGVLVLSNIVVTLNSLHLKNIHSPWLGFVFLLNFAALPILMWQTLKIEAVRKLVYPNPGELRRPASLGQVEPDSLDVGVPPSPTLPTAETLAVAGGIFNTDGEEDRDAQGDLHDELGDASAKEAHTPLMIENSSNKGG